LWLRVVGVVAVDEVLVAVLADFVLELHFQ
jgi:hypothetical protein